MNKIVLYSVLVAVSLSALTGSFFLGKSMYTVDLEKLSACLSPFSGEVSVEDKKILVVVASEIGKCIKNN